MKLAFILGAIALLAGCSTTAVQPENAKAAPADRVFYQGTGNAKITIIRDEGFIGSGCYAAVYANSNKVAHLETTESVTFNTEPGSVLLGVEPAGDGMCTWGGQMFTTESIIKANEHRYYRIFIGQYSSGPVIMPISPTK